MLKFSTPQVFNIKIHLTATHIPNEEPVWISEIILTHQLEEKKNMSIPYASSKRPTIIPSAKLKLHQLPLA